MSRLKNGLKVTVLTQSVNLFLPDILRVTGSTISTPKSYDEHRRQVKYGSPPPHTHTHTHTPRAKDIPENGSKTKAFFICSTSCFVCTQWICLANSWKWRSQKRTKELSSQPNTSASIWPPVQHGEMLLKSWTWYMLLKKRQFQVWPRIQSISLLVVSVYRVDISRRSEWFSARYTSRDQSWCVSSTNRENLTAMPWSATCSFLLLNARPDVFLLLWKVIFFKLENKRNFLII